MTRPITFEQRAQVDANISLSQENRRLREALTEEREKRTAEEAFLNAVVAAFFRSGASAANITDECWNAGKVWRLVENGDYTTISRTEAEARREDVCGTGTNGQRISSPSSPGNTSGVSPRGGSRRITALLGNR